MRRSETLPVPAAADRPRADAPEFTAQVLGQPGRKRGLREGAPALDRARSAYLSAEWSGPDDRRPPAGLIRKDAV